MRGESYVARSVEIQHRSSGPYVRSIERCPWPKRYLLQERCGTRAEAAFSKDYTPRVQATKEGTWSFNYENHYSEKLNKCFFLEISILAGHRKMSKQLRLYDLNENKEYGHFWSSTDVPTLVDCLVGETRCSSETEWRMLAKPYLQD